MDFTVDLSMDLENTWKQFEIFIISRHCVKRFTENTRTDLCICALAMNSSAEQQTPSVSDRLGLRLIGWLIDVFSLLAIACYSGIVLFLSVFFFFLRSSATRDRDHRMP